jgi:large subunit ribosomal protein L15
MMNLSQLSNSHRPYQKPKRVGRGVGSKKGKTCGKGNKGDKSRQGHKFRFGYEGGQLPLYKKLPTRGFTNGRFTSVNFAINLGMIDKLYNDGEVVSLKTLQEKGFAPRRVPGGLKILSNGELTKKVTIEAVGFSEGAQQKLKALGLSFKEVPVGRAEG